MKPDDCSFAAAAASAGHKRSLALTLVTQSNTGRPTLHLVIVRRRTEKSISVKEMVCRVIYTRRPESLLLQQEPPSSTIQHNPDHHRPARLADRYAKPETAAAAAVVVVVVG